MKLAEGLEKFFDFAEVAASDTRADGTPAVWRLTFSRNVTKMNLVSAAVLS